MKPSMKWSYSFWLGTASAALFLVLILSGLPLMFLYVPSVERAYASIKDIEYVITFGSWLRSSTASPPTSWWAPWRFTSPAFSSRAPTRTGRVEARGANGTGCSAS